MRIGSGGAGEEGMEKERREGDEQERRGWNGRGGGSISADG